MATYEQSSTGQAAFLPTSPKVLVTEDPFVSSFLRAVLQRFGYEVVIADAERAVALVRRGAGVDVVITNRPDLFLEFAQTVHLLYIAASPDMDLAAQFPDCRALRKPFRNDELLAAVDKLAHPVLP